MSNAAAPAPAAGPVDAEEQMAAELAALRQERASESPAPAPAPSPADAPAPANDAAAPAASQSTDAGNAPAADATSQAPAAPAPAAATDPAEQLKQLQTQLQQARSEIGRVGALNRSLNDARAELERVRQENATLKQAAPTAAQAAGDGAAKALEALEAKAKEFPELGDLLGLVTTALKATDAKVTATAKEAVDKGMAPVIEIQAERNRTLQAERAAAYEAAMNTFQTTYPNAVEVVRSQDFNAWIGNQPKPIQAAFYKGEDPAEATAVMDAYDAHLRRTGKASIAHLPTALQTAAPAPAAAAPKPSNNAERLERAAGIASRNTGAKGGMPPEDDFEASLDFFRRQRLTGQQQAA